MMALITRSILSTNLKLICYSSSLKKPNSILTFPASKLDSSKTNLELSTINSIEWSKTAAFMNGGSSRRKSSRMFQKDAFIEDSSSSHSESLAQHIQAILNRLSKWIVSAIFVGVLVWKKEAESLWLAMGSVVSVIICATLKRVLNEERPDSTLKSDPGMPSSHAQSIFYILVSILLSITEKFGVNELTLTMTGIALACGSYLSWLRVREQYHTMSQVTVGGAVGSMFSAMWFWLWHSFVFKAFISFWWVRSIVIFGAASFSFSFILHVIRYWLW